MTAEEWVGVDEGWGRRAVDFATLSEPANCREYVALHQHLEVGADDEVLDMACGSGLAIELARARGASCAGIDAASRLVAVARDRNPGSDIRAGDMNRLPWADNSFDVVTSFRGIWGTTPDAISEAARVLRPGGRLGITVWVTSKPPRAHGRCRRFDWPRSQKSRTRPRWSRWAGPGSVNSC